ncbi:MAG: TonB-dependent receptor, partial [Casimicrobiaceae bacterium]
MALVAAFSASTAFADGVQKLDTIEVSAHYDNSVGSSDAASAGVITPQLIDDRPLLRPGEVLEYIPGMIVTQHSGAGKANQ